jgi:glycosyltransferase involved in cell wall biosynthesis
MADAEIVIPCYNESSSLEILYAECRELINLSRGSIGFILVDNGSTDETKMILSKLKGKDSGIKFVELQENLGYGGGIIAGLKIATAPILGWSHADLQTPIVDCLEGVQKIHAGCDFVKGRRNNRPFKDRFFSSGMGLFTSLLFCEFLTEINAQPTLFRRNIYDKWRNPPQDFSLDLYALVMAKKSEALIGRWDVYFLERRFGLSSWNINIRSKLKFIRRTIKYSFKLRKSLNENL